MRRNKKVMKVTAITLLMVFADQLIAPNVALALTTGPSQPEVQSFEPVGTTDMVDMFSGSFVYNIPLLDVEGYPVNICYHGGTTMEQEASWVGAGWNLNPGAINRIVRGIPDDFNGATIQKELHIKDDKTLRVGLGGGLEIAGAGDPLLNLSASAGVNVNINNYRGVSCDFTFGGGVDVFHFISTGVNIGVGSQTGAEIDYNACLSLSSSQFMSKDMACGVGVSMNHGYSTRSGLRDLNFTFSASGSNQFSSSSVSTSINIPIGIKNYVPVITNSSTMNTIQGRIKIGGEAFWCYPYGTINGMFSRLHFNNDGTRTAYGYMYLQNASVANDAILDFTRDKDGLFNKSMQYLPPASMTYDIYSVSGQGTGGIFRPFRNDFGSVYDPATSSSQNTNSFELEAGVGDIFEAGVDYANYETDITSGPWLNYLRNFTNDTVDEVYENVYLKQGGEMTMVNPGYFSAIGGTSAIDPNAAMGLPNVKPGSMTQRDPRGNLLYSNSGSGQISQLTQVQKDGRRFVYGYPLTNNIQKEVTFSVNPPSPTDLAAGLASYTPGTDDGITNGNGIDQYYSSTITPAYAHSFLLTSVLSADYVDVTGNGPSDDDLGSYTKFNYATMNNDFRWRAPFPSGKAQYDPGFWSEPRDDKGSYVSGSRSEVLLNSIDTKNFTAQFYTSKRTDACGTTDPIVTGTYGVAPYDTALSNPPLSYKLDSIKLYNKHDYVINGINAVPIKSVYFVYDYSLCAGIPNTTNPGSGKLTLRKIYFSYGNSQKSLLSPYQFDYGYNPNYDLSCKDRWGDYKPNNPSFTNYEFPFVNQSDTANNTYASAWSLTSISLPSGGMIQAQYESNDYAFVQDKEATEMFMIQGIGSSPDFAPGSELYADKNTPYLYAYFNRRLASESSPSIGSNYFDNQTTLYYNFNVKLTGKKNSYEQIKGYATVVDIGACSDGVHGYIRFKPVTPTGGDANLNPVTYTALNVGRYNLPQIIFPGQDPDESTLISILAGLKEAFNELVGMTRSPIIHLVKMKEAKEVNLNKSYVRLTSVGHRKKGGGQRVKKLIFYDSWNTLAGGDEPGATYGKQYDYTINDPTFGTISSGVASYEPLIGGDENPLRQPVQYTVSSGSPWPPNDPIDLYQETPIGESLYPPATVGYRMVTVSSINSAVGKSSQGVDVYQFYTAKDFPIQLNSTHINVPTPSASYGIFKQSNLLTATQGYSLVLNDMHGKPKSIEHQVYSPISHTTTTISSQVYNYSQSGGQLNNYVNCLVFQPGAGMAVQTLQLGVESDVTIDTRHKKEDTRNFALNTNLNVAGVGIYIIPVPLFFPWSGEYVNEFESATVTKVTQQYGILDNVVSFNEGAVTTFKNEYYDPQTGNPVVTSVTNEFNDKEYTVNIPAYWCYKGMSPAYNNVNYQLATPFHMYIDTNHIGELYMDGTGNLNVGDECLLSYQPINGAPQTTTVWYLGNVPSLTCPDSLFNNSGTDTTDAVHTGDSLSSDGRHHSCCVGTFLPRYPLNTTGWVPGDSLLNISLTVTRPGPRNMLDQVIESYTTLVNPVSAGFLNTHMTNLISLNARTYCDSNTRIVPHFIAYPDSINPYAIGERGVFKLLSEYAYVTGRSYTGTTSRNSGLFTAYSLFSGVTTPSGCINFPYNYYTFTDSIDLNWRKARTISKWSPDGKEVEDVDALGNYSTSVYGYNQALPEAVASNAKQGDVLTCSFEDYSLLEPVTDLLRTNYTPFDSYFGLIPYSGYDVYKLNNPSSLSIVSNAAHTGKYSLYTTVSNGSFSDAYSVSVPINNNLGARTRYNYYYPYSAYTFSSVNEYLPFEMNLGKTYILSFWINQASPALNTTNYALSADVGIQIGGTVYPAVKTSNIIDGWQQVQVTFTVPSVSTSVSINLPVSYYIDDLRIFPSDAEMKSFVYNPANEKLMATLDENNFATFYEYDQEGNLVRTKKETERGIMTVSESRSATPKQ